VPESRAIRSVAVHLMALCLVFEHGYEPQAVTKRMGGLLRGVEPEWLEPPHPNGTLTVEHPLAAPLDRHAERVREWAEDVWHAWRPHHPTVSAWTR
jgi:Family of unknown function (DUF5946)